MHPDQLTPVAPLEGGEVAPPSSGGQLALLPECAEPLAEQPQDPPLAVLVTKDGRVVRLSVSDRNEVTLEIEGRGHPLRFDRWQSLALTVVCREIGA